MIKYMYKKMVILLAKEEKIMVKQVYPRVEINLQYLKENVAEIVRRCGEYGIDIAGVIKEMCIRDRLITHGHTHFHHTHTVDDVASCQCRQHVGHCLFMT